MTSASWLEVRAGARARQQLARGGLLPSDIGCIPAAAGGPKGLALLPLDRLLAREWLGPALRLELIGASIGAWRMTALAQSDPLAAIDRLQHVYVREQNYGERPSPTEVAAVCRSLARSVLAPGLRMRDGITLSIITARAGVHPALTRPRPVRHGSAGERVRASSSCIAPAPGGLRSGRTVVADSIVDQGKIVTIDSPENLMQEHSGDLEAVYLKLTGRNLAD